MTEALHTAATKAAECCQTTLVICALQEQHLVSDSLREALAGAGDQLTHLHTAQSQAHQLRQDLSELRTLHEAALAELASARGRMSAFDDSCRHSLDRVATLSAALQEAQLAKVSSTCSH